MSKKQLGSASGEESGPEAPKRLGWFGRLRVQPGFRTATVAFVLTVVLGIGSTAAYAYWSQKNTVTQTVTTVRQELPAITGKTSCEQRHIEAARIKFTPVTAKLLPADAQILVSVSIPDKRLEKLYIVPNDGQFTLRQLPGLSDAIGNSLGRKIFVSATTAYISGPIVSVPTAVNESNVLDRAMPVSRGAEAVFVASYWC